MCIRDRGKNEEYFRHESDLIVLGRAINPLDVENKNRVCVISESLQKKVFFAQSALGQPLQIGGITYTVVGIAEDSTSVEAMMNGTDCVYIPYRNALSMTGNHNVCLLYTSYDELQGNLKRIRMKAEAEAYQMVETAKEQSMDAISVVDDVVEEISVFRSDVGKIREDIQIGPETAKDRLNALYDSLDRYVGKLQGIKERFYEAHHLPLLEEDYQYIGLSLIHI